MQVAFLMDRGQQEGAEGLRGARELFIGALNQAQLGTQFDASDWHLHKLAIAQFALHRE